MLKKRNTFFSLTTILLLLLLGSFLTGCNIPKAGLTAVPTLELDADPTSAPTVEEIAYTPTLPPLKVWLTLGSNGNSGICDLFRAALVTPELSFVQVEEVENLTPSMITTDKKLVVFCGIPENLEEFTAVSGESVYAVVGNENRNLPNLWTIGYDPANELFMAGYFLGLTVAGCCPQILRSMVKLPARFSQTGCIISAGAANRLARPTSSSPRT
jgi:hypothetical protein